MPKLVQKTGKRYILDKAVLHTTGTYTYEKLTVTRARKWYRNGPKPLVVVASSSVAAALPALLDLPVTFRTLAGPVFLEIGDEALVCTIAGLGKLNAHLLTKIGS